MRVAINHTWIAGDPGGLARTNPPASNLRVTTTRQSQTLAGHGWQYGELADRDNEQTTIEFDATRQFASLHECLEFCMGIQSAHPWSGTASFHVSDTLIYDMVNAHVAVPTRVTQGVTARLRYRITGPKLTLREVLP